MQCWNYFFFLPPLPLLLELEDTVPVAREDEPVELEATLDPLELPLDELLLLEDNIPRVRLFPLEASGYSSSPGHGSYSAG